MDCGSQIWSRKLNDVWFKIQPLASSAVFETQFAFTLTSLRWRIGGLRRCHRCPALRGVEQDTWQGEMTESEEDGDVSQRPYLQHTGKAFVCSSAMAHNDLTIRQNSYWYLLNYHPVPTQRPTPYLSHQSRDRAANPALSDHAACRICQSHSSCYSRQLPLCSCWRCGRRGCRGSPGAPRGQRCSHHTGAAATATLSPSPRKALGLRPTSPDTLACGEIVASTTEILEKHRGSYFVLQRL